MRRPDPLTFVAVAVSMTLSFSPVRAGFERQTIDKGPGEDVNDLEIRWKPERNNNDKPKLWKSMGAGDTNHDGIHDPGEGVDASTSAGGVATWAQNTFGTLTNGDKVDIDYNSGGGKIDGDNSYWTKDGVQKDHPSVPGPPMDLSFVPSGGSTLLASVIFRNPGSTNLTYNNIVLTKGNSLTNYNLDNFTTVTGSVVSGPASFSLGPGGVQVVSLGTVSVNTYQLATADVYETSVPSVIYHLASADRYETGTPTLSEWGTIVLVAALAGVMLLMLRRQHAAAA
jgi:hypothetical protein